MKTTTKSILMLGPTYVLGLLSVLGIMLGPVTSVKAQDGECADGLCGTPEESGGGTDNSAVIISGTGLGDRDNASDDYDEDGIEDDLDNCTFQFNPDQSDTDGDGIGNACDLCAGVYSTAEDGGQLDTDGDGIGNECDGDLDGDGIGNEDNCPLLANPTQTDTDRDGTGNACDPDDDGDGFADLSDLCPLIRTPENREVRAGAEICDKDLDVDGITDALDNCLEQPNPDQSDTDGDGIGDACDGDWDGDGVPNKLDLCPLHQESGYEDTDLDGIGDACDPHFCYVVDVAEPESCLDPAAPFHAHAGPEVWIVTGGSVRLPLFANRGDKEIHYRWVVTSAPSGSKAVPKYGRGTVKVSTGYRYRYPVGREAILVPDVSGAYQLALYAELVHPDPHGKQTATARVVIVAEGDTAETGGCATAAGATNAPMSAATPALVVLNILRHRRW